MSHKSTGIRTLGTALILASLLLVLTGCESKPAVTVASPSPAAPAAPGAPVSDKDAPNLPAAEKPE